MTSVPRPELKPEGRRVLELVRRGRFTFRRFTQDYKIARQLEDQGYLTSEIFGDSFRSFKVVPS